MSSSFPPATPPLPNPVETAPPPEQSPSSPGNVDTVPPLSPVVPIQVPLPALSPPQSSPSPLVALPPLLPTGSPMLSPPPTLSPLSSPPPQPPLSTPQPPPQAPVIPPTPITKDIPPPIVTTPPITSPPLLTSPFPPVSKPKTRPSITTHPAPTPPLTSSPTPAVRQPNPGRITTKPGLSEPALPASPIPAVRQTKSSSTTTQPGPLEPGPSEPGPLSPTSLPASPIPASRQTQSGPTAATKPGPMEPGPSQPPAALPVPQTPGGGAWLPSTSLPPSILPSIPGTPTVENSPFVGDSNTGASSSSSSSSSLAPSGGNIEASTPSSGGSSGVVVGVIIGGVLLLVLGVVFGILATLCKRRKQKFADDGSGKMHAASFKGFEDKTPLPQYIKQGPKIPENQTTSKAHSTVASPTVGMGTHLSSGSFAYEELAIATSRFSDQNLLGQGGFGCVYKGVLPNGKEIAVKQLKMGGHQGEREFQAEVEAISQVHHKHLVSLVGYCISGVERLLVYEFVANNTLDFHLHGKEQPVMDWPTRMKIAIGSAKGLAYLHEDCSPSIIHRDIKAANILLDFNFEAKVSDFGLAKIFSSSNPSVTHMTTRVVGTFGYLAPEYASSGKVTDKSDVYSYGVVLLELITGCPPISNFGPATSGSLVNWARPLLAQAIADGNFDTLADSRLQSNYNVDEMISMVSCAAACVRLSSWRRPRMSQVIRALEGNLSASELDDGVKPGHSSMHFPYESLDFDARNYIDDMKRMALASSYSDNTSDYGLNASTSSTDTSKHIC